MKYFWTKYNMSNQPNVIIKINVEIVETVFWSLTNIISWDKKKSGTNSIQGKKDASI